MTKIAKELVGTWNTWRGIIQRCLNKKHTSYDVYGGAGIKVYFDWVGRGGFRAFLRDVGQRPKGHELDRIDPDGNYEPGNVRWLKQSENRSRVRRPTCAYAKEQTAICPKGKKRTMTMLAWSEHLGIPYKALLRRIQRGWKGDAFATPGGQRRQSQRRTNIQALALPL